MRASRLLRILLILQNRGRTTTRQLAEELEVAQRTVLRDIDAIAEAGLPIIVYRGNTGGIELGFNYRSRLVGLTKDESKALGVILTQIGQPLHDLGMAEAGERAVQKLVESLPDVVRKPLTEAQGKFFFAADVRSIPSDPRIPALVAAINEQVLVRLNYQSAHPQEVQPIALNYLTTGWALIDQHSTQTPIPLQQWGDINISALKFDITSG
ncbi:MAG: HTH domain-containing protein [Pseudomonadales bacterium]|nr:HTH domain-containing protein [Pseudomonadales bacterium]